MNRIKPSHSRVMLNLFGVVRDGLWFGPVFAAPATISTEPAFGYHTREDVSVSQIARIGYVGRSVHTARPIRERSRVLCKTCRVRRGSVGDLFSSQRPARSQSK